VVLFCQLVEGVPLGLELAASLAGEHSCAAIARALARNLDALRTAWQDVPDRHRTDARSMSAGRTINVRRGWQWAIDHGAMEQLGQLTWGERLAIDG